MSSNYAIPNLLLLLLVWMERVSGTLEICSHGAARGADPQVVVAKGGLVYPRDRHLLFEHLARRFFRWVPAEPATTGHRPSMGALLAFAGRQLGVDLDGVMHAIHSRPEPQLECVQPLDPGLAWSVPDGAEDLDRHQDELVQRAIGDALSGDWRAADRLLSRSRDIRFDHGPTLVWLAWVRLNNPELPGDQRRRDAEALLKVAQQLDVDDPQARAVLLATHLILGMDLNGVALASMRSMSGLSSINYLLFDRAVSGC